MIRVGSENLGLIYFLALKNVEKEAEKVALEHGNFQAKKLESTLDNLSANILNQKKQKSATSPVS